MFCDILALQRLANSKELSHSALIQTVVYYGWGVKNIVVNTSVFWGTAVSKRCLAAMSASLVKRIYPAGRVFDAERIHRAEHEDGIHQG